MRLNIINFNFLHFNITPFLISPKGERILIYSFPYGGRLGRGSIKTGVSLRII